MGIVFGPVPSRRYGISLGLDIIPHKTCSFNCVFCEVGPTTNLTSERKDFIKLKSLEYELNNFFKKNLKIDVITFAGSGEPTLNSEIGRMIRFLKQKHKNIPIVVLTNGSLLWMKEVREELLYADIVEPSLNSVDEETFIKIARPEKNIIFPLYLEGLIKFREEFKGRYFLEIFLVKGIIDSLKNIDRFKDKIRKINPEKIHLNTIDRPPALDYEPVGEDILIKFKEEIGEKAEIISKFKSGRIDIEIESLLLKTIGVRPLRKEDIYSMVDKDRKEIDETILSLKEKGIIKEVIYNGEKYIQGV